MNSIPFTKTESTVIHERNFGLEIFKEKGIYLNQVKTEATLENINQSEEIIPRAFNVFKAISRDSFSKMDTKFLID